MYKHGMKVDWLYPVLENRGITRNELAKNLTTPVDCLPDFLPISQYLDLLEWCSLQLDDPHLWLKIGLETSPVDVGLVGYLYKNSATISDLFDAIERYQVVYMTGMYWKFDRRGSLCEGRYHINHKYNEGVRHDIEFSVGSIVQLFSREAGTEEFLKEIQLPYPPAAPIDTYSKLLNAPIYFDQHDTCLIFDEQLLKLPLGESDPRLLYLLKQQIEETMKEIEQKNEFVDEVRLLIATTVGDASFDLKKLCQQLNVSTRTLHRKLKKHDMTYMSLREEIIRDLAKDALTKTDASITEIGLNLGFSEVSAFIRFFKKGLGVSPLQYRNKYVN